MRQSALILATAVAIGGAACSNQEPTAYAVGSLAYHAAPEACQIVKNDGAIKAEPDHHEARDGKGLVFAVLAPGEAVIQCGGDKTPVAARAATRLEIARTDGEAGPVADSDLYLPAHCIRAFDQAGKQLEVGSLTQGIEFTTSEHLGQVVDHGMGGAGDAACLPQQSPRKPGAARISVAWQGMTAETTVDIAAKK